MEYTGDDLLKVFHNLNIQLLNLNPNVIKAWFDTDDLNIKKFLNWMCSSLSKANYISPFEYAEFLELDSPLLGEKYQTEINNLNNKYPGILNQEENLLEIDLLQDELELLLEEEKQVDAMILQQETLQGELSKELFSVSQDEIQISADYKETLEECEELSNKLDTLNNELHHQLKKCGSLINDHAYNFEVGTVHQYITNLDVKLLKSNNTLESSQIEKSILDISTSKNDLFANKLSILRNRILRSHQNYLANKVEIEKLSEILNYLAISSIDDILYMKESIFLEVDIETKEESKKRLCSLLDTISQKQADYYIHQTKIKYAQQELETTQSKLKNSTDVLNLSRKMLVYYLILGMLHAGEEEHINKQDVLFRSILEYLTGIHKSKDRTSKMSKIIADSENCQPPLPHENLLKLIMKLLENSKDVSLSATLEAVTQFKSELGAIERKICWDDFVDHRKNCQQIIEDINIIKTFLMSGPTHRVVIVPFELQTAMSQVEKHLKKEDECLKSIVSTSTSMTKLLSKWQKYRRQLWMYFITDPSKLFLLIKQIEEEVLKQQEK